MAKEVTPADLASRIDDLEIKLDMLLERFGKPVATVDETPLTVTREGDHKYMPSDQELRKRAEATRQ